MVRCVLCSDRAGDRACPALGQRICSQCCGTHRRKRVRCIPSCTYLVTAERHIRERRANELVAAWAALQRELAARGDTETWPYVEVLAELLAAMLGRHEAEDAEVAVALADLDQALSPISLVGSSPTVLGRALIETIGAALQSGRLSAPKVRRAAQELHTWLEAYRTTDAPRRFVDGLLGLFPPRPGGGQGGSGLIVRP